MPFKKGNKLGLGNKYRLGKTPWNKGSFGIMKAWNKGKHTGNYGNGFKKGNHPKTEFKKGHVVPKGENHHSWKGGKDRRKYIMAQKEYKFWRISVFERDNYTCIWCGQKGGRLQADHIKPFSLFPELRFAIDNGRTLCESCHKKTDTYGWNLYHKNVEVI